MIKAEFLAALAQTAEQAESDYIINKPLPKTEQNFSISDALNTAIKYKSYADALIKFIDNRPGAITATIRILTFLEQRGYSWATAGKFFVTALPGVLRTISADLPMLANLANEFKAAPAPLPGMGPRVGRG